MLSLGTGLGMTRAGGMIARLTRHFSAGDQRPALVADFAGSAGPERYAKAVPVLGPELVTNGGFDTDTTGWSNNGLSTFEVVSGRLHGVANSNGDSFFQNVSVTDGRCYLLTFNHEVTTATIYDGTGVQWGDSSASAVGTVSHKFIASGSTSRIEFMEGGSGNDAEFFIDNVSVREIIGYRAAASTFAELFPDFSRSGNATMVDSDGLLKWAPHNLLTWSEDFSNAAWTKDGASVTVSGQTQKITENSSNTYHRILQLFPTSVGERYTLGALLSEGERRYAAIRSDLTGANVNVGIDLQGGTITNSPAGFDVEVTEVSPGEFLVECSATANDPSQPTFMAVHIADSPVTSNDIPTYQGDGVSGIYANAIRSYRSDLGGMVDNPDTGDSYVPTEGSAVYMARRNHHVWDGTAFVNKGLLVESEARTNLNGESNDFTAATWSKTRVTVTPSATTGPDGVSGSASLLVASTDNNSHFITDGGFTSAVMTASIFAKAQDYSWLTITARDSAVFSDVFFDLENGVIGTTDASLIGSMEDVGNGWYRCSVHNPVAETEWFYGLASADNAKLFTGNGTGGIYIFGAQTEVGATPSSYIPTNGSTVTRAAETLPMPSELLPFHPDGVWMSMGGEVTYADEGGINTVVLSRWLFDGSNLINNRIDTDGTNTGQFSTVQSASAVVDEVQEASPGSYTPGINVPFSIASRHGPTYINGAVDGVALTADLTPTALPNLSATDLQLAYDFMGTVSHFTMGAGDPGDAGIAEASA